MYTARLDGLNELDERQVNQASQLEDHDWPARKRNREGCEINT
jgi:hypothetical protein